MVAKTTGALKSLVNKAVAAITPGSSPDKQLLADIAKMFSPLDDRVVIERSAALEKTAGGLFIPGTSSEKPNEGKVLAVGPGHRDKKGRLRPLDVQLGDTVMFGQYAGSEIELSGRTLIVLRENEIVAIVS